MFTVPLHPASCSACDLSRALQLLFCSRCVRGHISAMSTSPPCSLAQPHPSKSLCLESLWPVPLPHHVQPCKSECLQFWTFISRNLQPVFGASGSSDGAQCSPAKNRWLLDFGEGTKSDAQAGGGLYCAKPNVKCCCETVMVKYTLTFLTF